MKKSLRTFASPLSGRVSLITRIGKKKSNQDKKLINQLKDIIISYKFDLEVFRVEIEKFKKYYDVDCYDLTYLKNKDIYT